jgi:hypothetical protein
MQQTLCFQWLTKFHCDNFFNPRNLLASECAQNAPKEIPVVQTYPAFQNYFFPKYVTTYTDVHFNSFNVTPKMAVRYLQVVVKAVEVVEVVVRRRREEKA